MLKALAWIFYYEIILLLRRSQEALYPLAFFVLMMILFPLSFTPEPQTLQKFFPAFIWLAALFASLLSLQNSFVMDKEEGALEQLALSAIPLPLLILAKLTAQWLVTSLPLVLLTPFLGLFFHLPAPTIIVLFSSLLLGTPILTLVGGLIAALTLGLCQQGVLLSLLILPLVIPVLIFSLLMVAQQTAQLSIAGPLAFLGGVLLLAICLLPLGIAASLRISLDE